MGGFFYFIDKLHPFINFSLLTAGVQKNKLKFNFQNPKKTFVSKCLIQIKTDMKRAKLLLALGCFLINFLGMSQVGIGTTSPTAKLDIDAAADAIPALSIRPRATAPTGTADGQIAMIDKSLYIYDTTRNKWLSSETVTVTWGNNGGNDDEFLDLGNVGTLGSGIKMPQNGTIVYISAQSSGGVSTKGIEIRKNNPSSTINTFNLLANSYTNNSANLDFNAGDFLKIYVSSAGGDVNDPVVTLWIKWRK